MTPYKSYNIDIHKRSEKFLANLPISIRKICIEQIDHLITDDFDKLDIKKLSGYKNLFRISIGDYRIVFSPNKNQKILQILLVGDRKDIYKILSRMPQNFLRIF